MLHGNNKPNERIHVDKSSKYAINGKLAKILGRLTITLGEVQCQFRKSVN